MKSTLLIATVVFMSLFTIAQEEEKTKQQELGLTFSGLNNFGLTYRIGKPNAMWRINTALISGSNSIEKKPEDSITNTRSSSGFNISLGKEFRKSIGESAELRFGTDFKVRYSKSITLTDDTSVSDFDWERESGQFGSGINLVFGFNYLINDNLILGGEILPYFEYTKTRTSNLITNSTPDVDNSSGYRYGLSNNSAMLSLVYRF